MIWCRFEAGGKTSLGTIENGVVSEVEGDMFGAHKTTGKTHPLDAVKLKLPVEPKSFYCLGVNYVSHITWAAETGFDRSDGRTIKAPDRPGVGYRAINALIATEEDIVKPKDSGPEFQYEGELVVVFSKTAKKVSKEDAMSCIFGYTIGNDVSERTWQKSDRTLWRAKNCDTFKPMGPWIVTGIDYKDMTTKVRLNGKTTSEFRTGDMVFDLPTYIHELTKYVTIQPGDVLWCGTAGESPNMKPGDVCEIEISGIGVLRNRIAAEQ